ncbi:ArnT family glycosyltransferase [Taibaiella lutea]|uniref:ArnT family glycosyltransferase n=1 Tax=Taibaiella lutea TaxID=2608001 RepID=UPI00167FE094|nr:glycosyltransferase family 39 protein [Taibaiella lutea]
MLFFNQLFNSRKKYWLLIIALLLFAAYQFDNTPRTDDEYLGEQVYWLMHIGKVKSDFGFSNLGYDVYQSIFHKLFVYIGYVFSKIFGLNLYTLHAVSLCFFAAFLFVFYKWIKYRYASIHNFRFYGVLILLLFNQDLLYAAADFRPEVMLMCLGFVSYTMLMMYFDKGKMLYLILAGIAAGLCMFAHLNGVIFIIAGLGFLLLKKEFKSFFLFGIMACIAFLPYFTDILIHADLKYFWHQFAHDPIVSEPHSNWYKPFLKLIEEQSRFLYNEKQVILTAMLMIALIGSYKKLKEHNRALLLYTLLLVVSMALLNPSKTTKYMVVYIPFIYLIIVEGWYWLSVSDKKKTLFVFQFLFVANLAVSIFYSGRQIMENAVNLSTGGIVAENAVMASKIPTDVKQANVLCPRRMVFNELGQFKKLQDVEMIAKDDLVSFLRSSDVDYLIFSERDKQYFDLNTLRQNMENGIQVLDSTQHYILMKVTRN